LGEHWRFDRFCHWFNWLKSTQNRISRPLIKIVQTNILICMTNRIPKNIIYGCPQHRIIQFLLFLFFCNNKILGMWHPILHSGFILRPPIDHFAASNMLIELIWSNILVDRCPTWPLLQTPISRLIHQTILFLIKLKMLHMLGYRFLIKYLTLNFPYFIHYFVFLVLFLIEFFRFSCFL